LVKLQIVNQIRQNHPRGQEKKMRESGDTQKIIATSDGLENLIKTIGDEKIIGVDLEADSMYHFKEKVCLIQIAARGMNVVIDPLMVPDLSPFKPLFKNPDIQKIFHGADYDVRSLYRDFRITINNLFDTELASRFLGYSETSLEAVLKNKFGVTLDKKYQRKDWSKRPLPEDMITYATKDVRYLLPLAESLSAELDAKKRLNWVQEECEYLSRVRPNNNSSDPLYLHFKGAGKLDPRSLAVLESLLHYRREIAQKKDVPLFRIFSSRTLLELAEKKPLNLKKLENCAVLSPRQIGIHGHQVIQAINEAMQIETKSLPVYPRKKSPKVPLVVAGRVKALKQWRDARAAELAVDPALVCTKSIIGTIALQKPRGIKDLAAIQELKNWQRKEFGHEIVQLMNQIR
jgi:ribonuclease D